MNIAITGTVGSGKSGVAAIIAGLLSIDSVDTDHLCRELLMPEQPAWLELRKRWADRFFTDKQELDRVVLREAVFSEPEIRAELEKILHPEVRVRVQARMLASATAGKHLLVEVPLLFEAGWQDDFDLVIAVYAPSDVCIARTIARDGVSHAQAKNIIELQMSAEEKAERADIVVDNSGVWGATVAQASHLARTLQERPEYTKKAVG